MHPPDADIVVLQQLTTPRLRLAALSQSALRLLVAQPGALDARLGLPLAAHLVTPPARRAIGIKLDKMAAAPAGDHPWYTYWLIVIASLPLGAGLAGFKGAPDADGAVEIGYGMDETQQGRGYMSEAVQALIAWAFRHPACRTVTASQVRRDNPASHKVLLRAGMRLAADTSDGLFFRIDRESAG